jgi:hypothetical protein
MYISGGIFHGNISLRGATYIVLPRCNAGQRWGGYQILHCAKMGTAAGRSGNVPYIT